MLTRFRIRDQVIPVSAADNEIEMKNKLFRSPEESDTTGRLSELCFLRAFLPDISDGTRSWRKLSREHIISRKLQTSTCSSCVKWPGYTGKWADWCEWGGIEQGVKGHMPLSSAPPPQENGNRKRDGKRTSLVDLNLTIILPMPMRYTMRHFNCAITWVNHSCDIN